MAWLMSVESCGLLEYCTVRNKICKQRTKARGFWTFWLLRLWLNNSLPPGQRQKESTQVIMSIYFQNHNKKDVMAPLSRSWKWKGGGIFTQSIFFSSSTSTNIELHNTRSNYLRCKDGWFSRALASERKFLTWYWRQHYWFYFYTGYCFLSIS